jgi:hypothetical protein
MTQGKHVVTLERLEEIRLLLAAGDVAGVRREVSAERARMAAGWEPPAGADRAAIKERLNYYQARAEGMQQPDPANPDFTLSRTGSLAILTPLSAAGNAWACSRLYHAETQFYAGGVVLEPRYVADIVEGIENDGLTVREEE